jgi:Uma2 family endonuclease
MASVTPTTFDPITGPAPVPVLQPLVPNERLDQPTFHARYEASPPNVRAELIEGIVYMSSPTKMPHSDAHLEVCHWLATYRDASLGIKVCITPTVILGPQSEPEPDVCLVIDSAVGGRTQVQDDYIVGPPELLVEIADSTEPIDLNAKKRDYERAGVTEYLVVALRQRRVHWFALRDGNFVDLAPGADGVLRSEKFPGLWLDPAALLARDSQRLLEVLRSGLASSEHATWVSKVRG